MTTFVHEYEKWIPDTCQVCGQPDTEPKLCQCPPCPECGEVGQHACLREHGLRELLDEWVVCYAITSLGPVPIYYVKAKGMFYGYPDETGAVPATPKLTYDFPG